jgi:prepilin-type processing-associated H-X9-DG protein
MKDTGTDAVTGDITYWYFGNPNPWYPEHHYPGPFGGTLPGSPPAAQNSNGWVDWRFWDTNHNGDNRDEYVIKLGEKGMDHKTLMTDQSRITGAGNAGNVVGFQFVHGNHKNFLNGWTNVLLADGHVESRHPRASSFSGDHTKYMNTNPSPDEVQPRFGNSGAYSLW